MESYMNEKMSTTVDKDEGNDALSLARFKSRVEDYLSATDEHRNRAATRRDYRCGQQLTDEEISTLVERGQPPVIYNYVGEKVSTMVGAEVTGRTAPNAIGRNAGDDQATASVATAAIRYVTDEADWNTERTAGREQLFVEGVVGTEIDIEMPDETTAAMVVGGQLAAVAQSQGNPEIKLRHVMYDRLYWDPMSRYNDFRDAAYYGTVIWQDIDEAIAEWPKYADELRLSVSTSPSSDEDLDDKPQHWVAGSSRRRVRTATIWLRHNGEWHYAAFCGACFLDGPRRSPYVDDRGRTIPGMVLQSCLVSRQENERIGPVQDLISPQDELNKRRSKALHLMNSKQLMAQEGSFRDVSEAKRQLQHPNGILFYLPGRKPDVIDHQAQIAENLALMQDARAAFESLGPSEAINAQTAGAGASGVAIERRQAGALLRFGNYIDNARTWELRVYRHIWFRIRQYWQSEDYVRITEDENAPTYLQVNQPYTVADMLIERGMEPEQLAQAQASGMLAQMGLDPAQVIAVRNHLQQLDVDVILEMRPASPTYRQDQIAAMADMLGKLPLGQEASMVAAEIMIEMVDLDPRLKRKFAEKLTPDPQQAQMQAMAQQQQVGLQQQLTALQMAKLQADVEKTMAEVAKLQAETDTEETEAVENIASANQKMADAAQKGGSDQELLIAGPDTGNNNNVPPTYGRQVPPTYLTGEE